jgi:DNA-binding NtrC family response regulator
MRQELNLLIVSSSLDNKKTLLSIIAGLPVNVYTTAKIEQAWEVLLDKSVDIILCDETLPDGTYQDFLCAVHSEHKMTRFVVLLSSDVWEAYLEAIRLGACDVIRCPYQPTDIELVLIRASRDLWQKEELRLAASA